MTAAIVALAIALAGAIGALVLVTRKLSAVMDNLADSEIRVVQLQVARDRAEQITREVNQGAMISRERQRIEADELRKQVHFARESAIAGADAATLRMLLEKALTGEPE